MKKEVTLLGSGPSRKECPFATTELWGVSECLLEDDLKDKKFTKVFALDGKMTCVNDHAPIPNIGLIKSLKKASELNVPAVTLQSHEPGTELYPLKEIVARFKTTYFGPSITYMIAYALYYGYEKFHIYGIDQGPELMRQTGKPKVTFWLGYASARGVELLMGRGSLKWTYSSGMQNLPIAWVREEYEKLYVKLVDAQEEVDVAND